VVDVSQSDYVAGLLVGVGSQGSLVTVRCGAGSVSFPATAGTTYYVMIFDFDGVGNGGLVNISFRELPPPPPPPTVDITVDPVGRVDPSSGIATFSGTYTCTNSDHIVINGSVRQNVGRLFTIQGYFNFYDFRDANDADPCDGTPHPWTANATPESGKFGGGRATVDVAPYTCTPGGCDGESLTLTVPLRGGAKTASASLNTLFLPAIPNRR
jgi:hypothetical protein